ncbi:MAG TPA: DUF1003 domain-containing protein [Myxococcales bacterium]|jgi:uncharacterized membrane protein
MLQSAAVPIGDSRHLDLLASVPLLRALPEHLRRTLAESAEERSYAHGEEIFARGDPGDCMYVIIEGEVAITLPAAPPNKPVVLRHLFAGDHFGELAVLDGGARTASASAASQVRLLRLSQEAFLSTALGSTDASHLVMRELTARLRNTTSLLAQRASRDVVRELDAKLTGSERFAIRVARWNGSWAFIAVIVLLSGGWMAVNAFKGAAFDPYPYVFFNLVLAILVVLQGPLLMMAQNRENRQERARAEVDYHVNLKNELALERLGQDVDHLTQELKSLRSQIAQQLLSQ